MAQQRNLIFKRVEATHKRHETTSRFILHGVSMKCYSEKIELRSMTLLGNPKGNIYKIPIDCVDTSKKHIILGHLN